jgi:hypothetical protein
VATKTSKPSANDDTLGELAGWVQKDMARWDIRNTRFQRDQDLFMLAKPSESSSWTSAESDLIILNDPRTMIKKVSRILARHPNTIEITPISPDLTSTAQRIENYCYSVEQSLALRWMRGLHNPYRYDQAFYLSLRGWLCQRTLLMPEGEKDMATDPAAIFDHQIFDPANVYPYVAGGQVVRVTHAYSLTAGELKMDPMMAGQKMPKFMDDMDDNTSLGLRAIYWKNPGDLGWYHGVFTGSEWVKEPTEIGYNPWDIILANGISYTATPWDDQQYLDQIGTGILDESAANQSYLNRAVTKLNALLSLEANPPVTIYTLDGTPRKINFRPGSRMFLTTKDKLEAHRVGPQLGDYKLLWDILTQRAERAGLPPAFFAEYTGESSMAHSVLMSAGRDVLYPYTEALNAADMLKYKKLLELYRDYGPGQSLRVKMQPNALGIGTVDAITAQDIQSQGTDVEVTRSDMTPQEMIQKLNLGMALADKKAISLRTFRGRDWINLRNPDRENLQVLAEGVYLNDQVIQALVPVALSETGQGMLAQVWSSLQTGMPQPGSPADQGAMPPGGPQGLPSQVLPPAMQTGNPLTNVNRAPDQGIANGLMGLINGGAFGGGGMGGTPPTPGFRPVPLFPSPAGL